MKRQLFAAILLLGVVSATNATRLDWQVAAADFRTPAATPSAMNDSICAPADSTPGGRKKSLFGKLLAYFNDANKNKKKRKFDFSVIGGPHYATDTKFGIGLVAEGLYHVSAADSLLAPSHVAVFGDVSTVGFYMLGIRGLHIAKGDKYRIDYTLYFYDFPCKYWGIGYDMGDDDYNRSKLKRWQAQMKASWLWRLASNLYLGPTVAVDYMKARDIEKPELLMGMDTKTWNLGIGFSLQYDTRDAVTNPHKGVFLSLSQLFRPKFLANDYAFSTTDLRTDGYLQLWKGAVLAGDYRMQLNFGNPSWNMMALIGNSFSMRGYYEGRYRDKHKMEAQIELRQHIWKRNSLTAWCGAGTVFNEFSRIHMKHVLPNYGIGYRWEFKKNVNVRLDYGFGRKGQSGFIFNINEAF